MVEANACFARSAFFFFNREKQAKLAVMIAYGKL